MSYVRLADVSELILRPSLVGLSVCLSVSGIIGGYVFLKETDHHRRIIVCVSFSKGSDDAK